MVVEEAVLERFDDSETEEEYFFAPLLAALRRFFTDSMEIAFGFRGGRDAMSIGSAYTRRFSQVRMGEMAAGLVRVETSMYEIAPFSNCTHSE